MCLRWEAISFDDVTGVKVLGKIKNKKKKNPTRNKQGLHTLRSGMRSCTSRRRSSSKVMSVGDIALCDTLVPVEINELSAETIEPMDYLTRVANLTHPIERLYGVT